MCNAAFCRSSCRRHLLRGRRRSAAERLGRRTTRKTSRLGGVHDPAADRSSQFIQNTMLAILCTTLLESWLFLDVTCFVMVLVPFLETVHRNISRSAVLWTLNGIILGTNVEPIVFPRGFQCSRVATNNLTRSIPDVRGRIHNRSPHRN